MDSVQVHSAISAVNSRMRELHRYLIDATKEVYQRETGPINGPFELYGLLLNDPTFAWMRPMSGLMAQIDETLDRNDLSGTDAASVRQDVEALLAAGPGSFADQVRAAQADQPLIQPSLTKLREAVAALPAP